MSGLDAALPQFEAAGAQVVGMSTDAAPALVAWSKELKLKHVLVSDFRRQTLGKYDALGLVGTPDDSAARIVEMAKLGVRNLYVMPLLTFGLPEPELAAFRDVVFPRLAAAGVRPAH